MTFHGKKMIAPIIITALMVIYYVFYFGLLVWYIDGILKYILGIIPLIFTIMMVAVCIERIKEIKKGEEDDLSQY